VRHFKTMLSTTSLPCRRSCFSVLYVFLVSGSTSEDGSCISNVKPGAAPPHRLVDRASNYARHSRLNQVPHKLLRDLGTAIFAVSFARMWKPWESK